MACLHQHLLNPLMHREHGSSCRARSLPAALTDQQHACPDQQTEHSPHRAPSQPAADEPRSEDDDEPSSSARSYPATTKRVLVGWPTIRTHQTVTSRHEEVCHLDDAGLDPSGHGRNLLDLPMPGPVTHDVHHEVDARRDCRNHECVRDVLSGQQRQRAELRNGVASRVRMDRAHSRQATVQSDQQVEALLLADLPHQNALRSHPQRLFDEPPQPDLSGAFEVWLSRLHRHDVRKRKMYLENLLTRDHALVRRYARAQAPEEGSSSQAACHRATMMLSPRPNRGLEKEGAQRPV